MPWSSSDARAKTHFADTPELQSLWAAVANKTLEATCDEGRAIREANASCTFNGLRIAAADLAAMALGYLGRSRR
jgi:hypothetical protein